MTSSGSPKMFGGVLGIGTLLAFVLSWFAHHSLVWAIVHAVYSWFYVAYYALTKTGAMAPIDASPAMTTFAVVFAIIAGVGAIFVVSCRRR